MMNRLRDDRRIRTVGCCCRVTAVNVVAERRGVLHCTVLLFRFDVSTPKETVIHSPGSTKTGEVLFSGTLKPVLNQSQKLSQVLDVAF